MTIMAMRGSIPKAFVASLGFVFIAYCLSVAVLPGSVLHLSTESTGTERANVRFESYKGSSAEVMYVLRVGHSLQRLGIATAGGMAFFLAIILRANKSRKKCRVTDDP